MTDKDSDYPLIGEIIDERYEILEPIGKGGFGSVYKAKDRRVKNMVAVKVLRPECVEDDRIAARFQNEAIIAGRIPNRHITAAFDHGLCVETKVLFIAMEYVPGPSLKELIKQKNGIDIETSLRILIQLCDGIAAAHDKNILHRDIKPSNIILTGYDSDPNFVKITDFGISTVLLESEELKRLTNTETANPKGTCLYMAPEQFTTGYKPDFPLDIYSIGCVLFELLTGKPPFNGGSDAITAHLHATAEIPVLKLDSTEPVIRSRLTDIVNKALAKDPSMRYQSAKDLQLDLEKLQLRVKELSLHRTNAILSTLEQFWLYSLRTTRHFRSLFKKSNAYILAVVAIVVIVLVTAAIMVFQNKYAQDFVLPQDKRIIELEAAPPAETATDRHLFEDKEKQYLEVLGAYRTFGKLATAEALPLLRKFGYFYLKSGSPLKAFQQFYKAQQLLTSNKSNDPNEEIKIYLALAECSLVMSSYPQCIDYAQKALEVINKLKDTIDYRTFASNSIDTLELLGRAAIAKNDSKTAEAAFLKMYDIARDQDFFAVEPERHATSFSYAANYFFEASRLDFAEIFLKYAIKGWHINNNQTNEAVSWNQLGLVMMSEKKYKEAVTAFENAETTMMKSSKPSSKYSDIRSVFY